MLRPEVDRPDRAGPGALEPAGPGLAVADHPELARGFRPAHRPQDLARLDAADGRASPPLATRAGTDPGPGWRVRGGQAGTRLSASSGGHGLPPAAGCGPVRPAGATTAEQARPQAQERGHPRTISTLFGKLVPESSSLSRSHGG